MATLLVDDHWLEEVDDIKLEIKNYFSKLFTKEKWRKPLLDGVVFPMLSEAEGSELSQPFSMEELEEAVDNCDGN